MRDNSKLISGFVAIAIYLGVVFSIFYYFDYRSNKKSIHYVATNDNSIAVSLANPNKKKISHKIKRKKTQKKKPKKIRNIVKKKSKQLKKIKPKKKIKKLKPKDLFASINSNHKSKSKESTDKKKAKKSIKKAHKKDKGVKQKYFASIEEKLKGWPAQANFAGETIFIWLKIYKNGSFDFKIKKLSSNTEFNESLLAYIRQLQSIGFGSHNHSKPYEIEVEFVATD